MKIDLHHLPCFRLGNKVIHHIGQTKRHGIIHSFAHDINSVFVKFGDKVELIARKDIKEPDGW